MDNEIKWAQFTRNVYSTEEFTEFTEAVKQQGGHVIGTFSGRAGNIQVTYKLPIGEK